MLKKAAIYIRVSTDAQAEEGYSIDAQKEQLAAYCVSKGIKNYEFYVDGGWSGSNINRPEMQRLIKDAENNKISHCIVYKLDRLSRSQKDTLYLIEDVFIPHDVAFVSLNETMDTSTPMGKLMIGILSAFAQLERENIRLRTRMGMKERVKNGYWMGGGRVPFGYDYDKNQGILVPNKDADTVREAYNLYLQGYSAQKVADILGLKYDKLAIQILTRKSNYGIIEYNGEEYEGRHEPIITKEIYDKTMAEMKRRSKNNLKSSTHLLTGLVYCGHCGAKMRYQQWNKNKECKFVCYSQQTSKKYLIKDPNCPQDKVWTEEIENEIIQSLFLLKEKKTTNKKDNKEKSVLELLYEQKDVLESKIKKLYNLYAESDNDLLLDTINENNKKLTDVEQQIIAEEDKQMELREKLDISDNLDSLENIWNFLDGRQKQAIIRSVVDKIVITDDVVEINYNL